MSDTPLWCLQGKVAESIDPQSLNTFCDQIQQWWPETQKAIVSLSDLLGSRKQRWSDLLEASHLMQALLPLILDDQIKLLDGDSISALKLKKHIDEWQQLSADAQQKASLAQGWKTEVTAEDINTALHAAVACEGKWWLFLSGRWRRAKKLVKEKGPVVTQSYTETLKLADQAFAAKQGRQTKEKEIEVQFNLDDFTLIEPILDKAWKSAKEHTPVERQIYRACIDQKNDPETLIKISKNTALRTTEAELSTWLTAYTNKFPDEIYSAVDGLRDKADIAFEVADLLQKLDAAGLELSTTIRTLTISLGKIEIAIASEEIAQKIRRDRHLSRFDGERIDTIINELDDKLKQLRGTNSSHVVQSIREYFYHNINRASGSMAGTTQDEKDWRRAFNRGRKLLEREFEKTRAYKSIRELLDSEASELLRNLKPVWMMSPLSVSDVLPLSEKLFDVVIFDEASQIPLEDAVPALYRARQMIVVGDEMQLPPSAFFSSQDNEEEDQLQNLHIYNLNADSFLNRTTGALPTSLLNWHYRSRHESLIGFCNQAFYAGKLQTIPSKIPNVISNVTSNERDKIKSAGSGIVVSESCYSADDLQDRRGDWNLNTKIYSRPISYHKLINSSYDSQRNTGEARYIARLVRELLLDEHNYTIGIVAFSQAQQQEIESAILRLANEDKVFANKLDAEEERTHEGQFVGLFIKNLENVQGDERDIIILSVCYGPNSKGKMLMNFGPINQNGGEKRLNVIFSRAKKNMVVVTSIEAIQITNTYNAGANALRQYLRYAKAVSEGDSEGMQAALVEYGFIRSKSSANNDGALRHAIAERLREQGLVVEIDYGQSSMKCDLAIRHPSDNHFSLGVLTDNSDHYKIEDLINRYHTPASILTAFGWDICHILATDWYKDPDAVIEKLLKRFHTLP